MVHIILLDNTGVPKYIVMLVRCHIPPKFYSSFFSEQSSVHHVFCEAVQF